MEQNEEYVFVAGGCHLQRELIVNDINKLGTINLKFIDIETNKQLKFTNLISRFHSLLELYPFEQRPQIIEDKVKWIILQSEYKQSKSKKVLNKQYVKRKFIYQQKKLKQISSYYGIPILNINNKGREQIVNQIVNLLYQQNYLFIRNFQMRSMTYEKIFSMDIEKQISIQVIKKQINIPKSLIQQLTRDKVFGKQIFDLAQNKPQFKAKLISKWLVAGQISIQNNAIIVKRQNIKIQLYQKYALLMAMQGQSKMLFKVISSNSYFNNFVFIILKSTIYSHKKQATGQIENLGKVRAYGSKIFLQFLNRNDLNHAYRCVNQEGIIFSQFQQISPIQIVFKKYYVGTDKHSYYGMQKLHQIVQPQDQKYKTGIYIRFDWRNPNHISTKTKTDLTQNPYYYLIQSELTKNIFFDRHLTDTQKAIPYGDKCVYPELIEGIIDVNKARFNLIKLYCSFQYYMHQVGLQVLDGCFMLDVEANTFWSEINPDCMRIKSNNLKQEYDKDIWRAGGSSSKQIILKKWVLLNNILTEYLLKHRQFLSKQYPYKQTAAQIIKSPHLLQNYKYIYQQLAKPKKSRRQIIATIDISKQMPSLVVSSSVSQTHSQGNLFEALQRIKYFDEILIVNLDGAFGDIENSTKNIKLIKQISKKHVIMSGGGIHNINVAKNLLDNGIDKIVVATKTTTQLLSEIPSNRVIIQLSINQHNEVLIDGRKTNTKVNVINKMQQLIKLGITTFSITFVKQQGHLKGLPYEQIQQLIQNLPTQVQKIIIAGGITTLDDLKFLWRFENVIPQLGSAIWKQKISVGQIFKQIANFDQHGLIPAIIKSTTDVIKGQIFLNQESLIKTVETGYLHRYSRQHKKVMKKGDRSGDVQKVLRVSFDCDADSLLIIVDSEKKFCHLNLKSCYHCQNMSLHSINQISQHIKRRKNQNSYSGIMQRHSGLSLQKLLQQIWQLTYVNNQHKLSQCADLLAHFLMYVNGQGINFQDIIKQLSFRTNIIKKSVSLKSTINTENIIIGWQIISTKIKYNIIRSFNKQEQVLQYKISKYYVKSTISKKYQQYFKNKNIHLILVDPLDISWLLTIGLIDMVIGLNTTIQNKPQVSIPCIQFTILNFKLCLLKRIDESILLQQFSSSNKLKISSQFIKSTYNFLTFKKHLSGDAISIYRVHGNNNNYLLNQSHCNVSLCDGLIFQSNINPKLQIFETIIPQGQIKIGLYKSIRL